MFIFSFIVPDDFTSARGIAPDAPKLGREILTELPTFGFQGIVVGGEICNVNFRNNLSVPQQARLASVIAAHIPGTPAEQREGTIDAEGKAIRAKLVGLGLTATEAERLLGV